MFIRRAVVLLSLMVMAMKSNASVAELAKENIKGPEVLIRGIDQVLQDLQNEKVFNPKTCATYINGVTDYLFYLPASRFIPQDPQNKEYFKTHGVEMVEKIFRIRTDLHKLLQQYDQKNELEEACIQKIREGFQYARFTEEYLIEWLEQNKVITFKEEPILQGSSPFVLLNRDYPNLTLRAGDVLLIRGKSYVSAMIARIGDEEGNFSHLAIVGQDEKGSLQIVESLIQEGVVVTPLEEWRKAQDARVALYRMNNEALATVAARRVYQWGLTHPDYDFQMDDFNYDTVFCSEVVRYAYDKASEGKILVPKFRSHVTKFKDSDYPKTLGVTQPTLFAPYDIEVDPRFDFVAEGRYYPLLRQVRMQDSALQSIYSWMIDKKYDFHPTWWIRTQPYIGKALRYLGFMKDQFPTYMPIDTMRTTLQFEIVAGALEKNLYGKEDEYYKAHGYLPSFQEMMIANDQYRKQDCEKYQKEKPTEFHYFFRGPACE